MTYVHSLRQGLLSALADDRVHVLGEDILDPYGGAFKVTAGLSTAYPDRVLTTPISEAGFTGVAIGMALRGLRPVVEVMFGDFVTLCADQLVNHAAKFCDMYGRRLPVPLVLRTPMGGGRGYGPTHSQSLEKLFLGIPNLKIVSPSLFHQPGSMLAGTILDSEHPVLFVEHKLLYPAALGESGGEIVVDRVPDVTGYETALVRNYRQGSPDVTIVTYGGCSRFLTPLLEELAGEEINVKCILPGSLHPVPVDTIVQHVDPRARVIILEEGTEGFNWGSEIAVLLYEHFWNRLSGPIRRVAAAAEAIPCAKHLEARVLPTAAGLSRTILEVLG